MLGDGGPGGAGRGDGAPPTRVVKKRKFVPTVRARHKRTDGMAPIKAPPEPPPSSETFSELMQQAESEAKWERAGGRRRAPDQRKAQTVAFGALLTGSAAQGHAGKVDTKAGPAGLEPGEKCKSEEEKPTGPFGPGVDGTVYYPTVLPLRPEGKWAGEDESRELNAGSLCGLSELALDEDDTSAARELGLMEQSAEEGPLMLLQLPTVLPVPGAKAQDDAEADGRREAGQAEEAGGGQRHALKVREVPAGRIGKLLVYRSGKVKMSVGDVMMDVTCGTPWPCRQEVVAVNVDEVDGHCVFLGDVTRRAVCTPDIFQLLGADPVGERQRGRADT